MVIPNERKITQHGTISETTRRAVSIIGIDLLFGFLSVLSLKYYGHAAMVVVEVATVVVPRAVDLSVVNVEASLARVNLDYIGN